MNNTEERTPDSPTELMIKNHEFTSEEILSFFNKLNYSDRDNLLYHMMISQRDFYMMLINRMKENKEYMKSDEKLTTFMNLMHDFSIMKSIIDSHSLI